MHGIDLDYGNESNSLKCIMLISYLFDLTEDIKENGVERTSYNMALTQKAQKKYDIIRNLGDYCYP
ncbi:hypothetical protein CDQ83_11450 [Clostridium thermosuccinogenes]|nr:hypothetical protein CDQ83_11450 [Pseudoclostridium thermosuccinogenes]